VVLSKWKIELTSRKDKGATSYKKMAAECTR